MKRLSLKTGLILLVLALSGNSLVTAEGLATSLSVSKPLSNQVFQRDAKDHADVMISGVLTAEANVVEAKAELIQGMARGKTTEWVVIASLKQPAGGDFAGKLQLAKGGWYKITVRARKGAVTVAEMTVDKVGVGEVFVTAGQSNSANFGNPRQRAKDDRVVYFNGKSYVPAQDPIPGGCGGGGSPWPILGDLIVQSQGVPVCFRSASLTWTEVKNWLPPDTQLYRNLAQCVKAFGTNGVRAVLWHQGESDSLAKTSPSDYCERLKTIIETLNKDCGYQLPWGVAQASFHPGSQEPEQKEVAKGQQMLWAKKIAFKGPVTDDLLGTKYRSDGVHFNQEGLNAHADGWFQALKATYGWKSE